MGNKVDLFLNKLNFGDYMKIEREKIKKLKNEEKIGKVSSMFVRLFQRKMSYQLVFGSAFTIVKDEGEGIPTSGLHPDTLHCSI